MSEMRSWDAKFDPTRSGSEQSRIRAAVIEDNAGSRELQSIVLQDSFDIVTYQTAEESLASLPKETPDVLSCDLLPDFDGRVIPRKLRAEG